MNGVPVASALPAVVPDVPADRVAALFDAHNDRLYRLARRLAPTADAALDLVQEAFLKVARAPLSVPRGLTNEEAWLVRILVNIARDQWRRDTVRQRYKDTWNRSATTTSGDEAALVARDTVWRALDALAPRRRAVVVLHELEDLDVKDAARRDASRGRRRDG